MRRMATIGGNALITYGSYKVLNPEIYKTQTLVAKYETRRTPLTSNELFLSEKAYERFSEEQPRHVGKTGDRGKPTRTQRFSYVTQYERGRLAPRWLPPRGKIIPDPQGPDFIHTMEDFETREKRYSRERMKGRAIIGGGAMLKYGTPVLIYGWMAHDIVEGNYYIEGGIMDSNNLHDAIGPLALPVTIAVDAYHFTQAIGDFQRGLLGG